MRMFTVIVVLPLFTACGGKQDASNSSPRGSARYAAYEGDWLMEAYARNGSEPLVIVLMKATSTGKGWTVKFSHLDEPLKTRTSIRGDSVITFYGPFPSALRDGATVRSVRSALHADGMHVTGTFVATYGGGVPPLSGRIKGERIH